MSLWIIVVFAVVGVALVILAVVLLVRQQRRAPKAPSAPSLGAAWSRFVRGLPASARRDPVVVVLGERLAGKSRLVLAALEQGGGPALAAPDAPDDPRLTLFAGRQALVQEISGDLLEDTRAEARDALRELWEPLSLEVPLVVVVLDAGAPSWSPVGLRRLGALARAKVDLLTALRGTPPRVRVCLTHLDEAAEGFRELAPIARDAGHTAELTPAGRSASELSAAVAPLGTYVSPALATLSPEALGRVTRFLTASGPGLLGALAPFLDALLGGRGAAAPSLEGIVLAGLPEGEGGAAVLLGDPLSFDGALVDRDARVFDRRRARAAALAVAAGAALLLGAYGWHLHVLGRAGDAVDRLERAAEDARRAPPRSWPANARAREAEAAAADALSSALRPLWPPLRVAFPSDKQDLVERFLTSLRELYLLPPARAGERGRRIYALSLLYASRDSALGERIRSAPDAWAAALDIPARVALDYIDRSERPWSGSVAPPSGGEAEVSLADWEGWLGALDEALRRETLGQDGLDALQKQGAALSASIGGAVEVDGLDAVIEELRAVRGDEEVDALLGPVAARRREPRWVTENREALEGLLAMVGQGSLAVPSAKGKSLREALKDLAVVGGDAGAKDAVHAIVVDGRATRTYETRAFSDLLRSSRSGLYVRAFVDDVGAAGRSPFFARASDYPAVGLGDARQRGATRSLPGTFTARAVEAEIKPPLLAFDAALEGARVPRDERAALTRLVADGVARHASEHRAALWAYVSSFRLDVTSAAGLRADLEAMIGPASWFTDFWVTVAENARVEPEGNAYLQVLADALAAFRPIVEVMAGEKGKYPALDAYYAVISPMLPSLDDGAPAAPGPADAPLADRLPPIGKLGLAILDVDKPAPLQQVTAWLDGARIHEKAQREPFLAPVSLAYGMALQRVERTIEAAWREQVRPQVAPLLARFPLDPRGEVEVSPEDLLAAVGPKGTFRSGVDQLLGPVCRKGSAAGCTPKAPAGSRAVRVPGEAVELAAWAEKLAAALWDDGGNPRAIALQVRPQALPEVQYGAGIGVTRSFLRSGETTVYGFNQTPAWRALPVTWWTSSAASAGMEQTLVGASDTRAQTIEISGSAWRFYRLLCRAAAGSAGVVTWPFDPPVSFDMQPAPWALVVPPGNRGRRCVSAVATGD
ncbi:hypothetical protein AB3662_17100 [Sorangium cellulosum]|uniref:hypothetical protein n=1 Tax=Sorangium cellulosum TaxID=56 RepID=UPI003D9A9006